MFSLKVFGGASLEGPHGPLTGKAAHRRRLALLSVLAVARRPVGRERLIGLLWPESPSDSARHLLSEALYVLRKALGEGAFVSAGDEVGLNGEVVCSDVGAFEAALEAGAPERAVELYRGAFLDGFYLAEADAFETWKEEERDRLARAYARALETLAGREEGEGRWLAAAEWWRRLLAYDPFSTRVALRLVKALDAGGERAAALRVAAAHAARMREELGVEPDAEFAAYLETLRAEMDRNGAAVSFVPPPPPGAVALLDTAGFTTADTVTLDRDAEASPPEPLVAGNRVPREAGAPFPGAPESRKSLAYYGGLFGVLVGMMLAVLSLRPAVLPVQASSPEYDLRRIAILYFEDLSPTKKLEDLAAGMTIHVTHVLTQVEALDVVSANGVKPFRDRAVPLDSMIRVLRAGSIVQGTVQQSANRVRVTIQLTDANTGTDIESHIIERDSADLFRLLDDVSDTVAVLLRKRVGREIRLKERSAGTENAEALRLVLKAEQARENAADVGSVSGEEENGAASAHLGIADSLLAVAHRLDPRWAEPVALRGWVSLWRSQRSLAEQEVLHLHTALDFAERALRLDRHHPGALELRGTVLWTLGTYQTNADSAEALFDRAQQSLVESLHLDETRASAWRTLNDVLWIQGEYEGSYEAAKKAFEADAYLLSEEVILQSLFQAALALARYDLAAEHCVVGEGRFARDWRFTECKLVLLARNASLEPDTAEAVALLNRLNHMDPPDSANGQGRYYTPAYRQMQLAAVFARAGEHDRARTVMSRAQSELGDDVWQKVSFAYDEAYLRMLLGERDAAIRALGTLLTLQPHMRRMISKDPLFANLRDEPAFRRITTRG